MLSVHDARNPARPDIKVGVFGFNKIEGLSGAQVKAMRNTNPTTPEHLRGGCFTVGLPGLRRACKIVHTRPTCKHRTPGRRRTVGTTSRAPQNMVFQGRCESGRMRNDRVTTNSLKRLMRSHMALCRPGADGVDLTHYKVKRDAFLARHPYAAAEIKRIEIEHYKTAA